MIRKHTRFALRDVQMSGVAVGSATLDRWDDDASAGRWVARVLIDAAAHLGTGQLTGEMRDGTRLRGQFRMATAGLALGGRKLQIVELFGVGPLDEVSDQPTDDVADQAPGAG